METDGLEEQIMKKVFGVLAFLSFFYLLGVVGAVEQDTMTLGAGMVRMGIGLGCFWLFCELSGAFYPDPPRKKKEPLTELVLPSTASVKAQSDYIRTYCFVKENFMNSTIAKLADEFEKMEKTIASQKKMIETLMPTGYVDTDTVKLHLNSVYGVMFGGRPSPKRCKLEDCSWDEINMYSSFGLADKMFEVGDTKKFRLADGSYLTARIIGFNHDYARDGSLVHITFETVETLDGDIPMNEKSTNEGGWDASYLRAKLNGNFFEKQLPADLKSAIKPVVKMTAKSSKNEVRVPSVDKLFVLSEQEVFGRKIYSCGYEGKWYEWYKRENTPYGKCKQNGERDWRWERSPCSGNTNYFCCVSSNGGATYSNASYSRGVSFGFCV